MSENRRRSARLACGALLWLLCLAMAGPSRAISFTRITTGPAVSDGGASRSVNWIDFDGDGDLDLFVSNGPSAGQDNFLYRNLGAPSHAFERVLGDPAVSDGAKSDGSSWGDADGDGDPDLFVVNWYDDDNLFYLNQDGTGFERVVTGDPVVSGGHSETCAWADYDNDGRLDLYVTNSGNSSAESNWLYRNEGSAVLGSILNGPPVEDIAWSRGAAWADIDGDGDQDLFVANESGQPNDLYRSLLAQTGSADFEAVTSGTIVTDAFSSFSGSWGDYDNDGDLDLFVANWGGQHNGLYRNDGAGVFDKVAGLVPVSDGGWSICAAWGDLDNDGDLDLFVTNGYGGSRKVNFLYRNQLAETGSSTFEKITAGEVATELGWSFGCALGDYDRDGDLDIFVAKTYGDTENNALFRNESPSDNHWLVLRLRGTVSNASAIGARARLYATVGGVPVEQVRCVEGQSGYCGQNLEVHFGLGGAAVADSLVVEWPSGVREVLPNLAADAILTLVEGSGTSGLEPQGAVDPSDPASPTGPSDLPGMSLAVSCVPNPSRGPAVLRFTTRRSGTTSVTLYASDGRLVRRLQRSGTVPGALAVPWDGRDAVGRPVPAGVYHYRVTAPGGIGGGRVVVAR